MSCVIWWLRRDLRLQDNQALTAALQTQQPVIPVFIVDDFFQKAANSSQSTKRKAFLWSGLQSLDVALRSCGSYLIIRHGSPVDQLQKLFDETGATAVFAEADFSPYATRRDEMVGKRLPLHLIGQTTIHHPASVLKADGTPYVVFTPYSKIWRQRPLPGPANLKPAPSKIATPPAIASHLLPEGPALPDTVPFLAGEAEARRRLTAFSQGSDAPILDYDSNRNILDLAGTSQLSPYLRFGMISPRETAVAAWQAIQNSRAKQTKTGAETWLNELIWREFYISILYHYPHVSRGNFRPKYDQIPWRNNRDEFSAWCNGRTGFPVVDAAMRQLAATGWMHNRARMIVASFLVKDLLIDWRWGEKWFMQNLIDGDLAANNGGWQWAAGTGTDAAPYFRIFNPTTQSKKFDPEGSYIRKWVPELSQVANKFIHEPAKMTHEEQRHIACLIGEDYPPPIVDHKQARLRTLAAYKLAKSLTPRQ